MGIFSFLKKKRSFFSAEEQASIVEAIRMAEKNTSGEIRLFIESRNSFMDPIDRASEIFFKLKMEQTDHRNGVLLYIALDDHQLALFADEGIYQALGKTYWDLEVQAMISEFSKEHIVEGIRKCIADVGEALTEKFPYIATEDKNELPDDIIFGK